MTDQKITFQEAVTIEAERCRNALSAMAKAFRVMALSTARKRDEETMRKCQEPPLIEKRKQAKKNFNEFVRSH